MDGTNPNGLVQATDGDFYGTTIRSGGSYGEAPGYGMAFKVTPGGTLTTLYSLCSHSECPNGAGPNGLARLCARPSSVAATADVRMGMRGRRKGQRLQAEKPNFRVVGL